MKELLFQYVLPPVLTALGLGAAWCLTQLGLFISAKWKGQKAAEAVSRVTHFASVIVADLEGTMRPEVQKAMADGHLSPEEGKRLKEVAMARLKQMLAEQGMAELTGLVGVFAPTLEGYLSGLIERAVANQPSRLTGAVAMPLVPAHP